MNSSYDKNASSDKFFVCLNRSSGNTISKVGWSGLEFSELLVDCPILFVNSWMNYTDVY